MKKHTFRRTMARLLVFAMLLTTAAGFVPAKDVAAAPLSEYLNMEFGIKYTGERAAVKNEAGNAWSIEYFNVADSAFKTGDVFFVSCNISGATSFKQACIQSGANNWDWNTSPKTWTETGIADGTTVCGKIVATKNGDKLSFKIQFDNVVADATVGAKENITLTDLYIMKLGTTADDATTLPANKALNLGTKYTATVPAVKNGDVYEAQYFTVNDASYSEGDTYIISYSISGAGDFRQVATQSSLTNYSWAASKKVWAADGLPNGQDVSGSFTTATAGNGISFKVRLDSPLETATLGDSVDITLNDLIVVKVANDDSLAIPSSMDFTKGRKYSGTLNAEKDTNTGAWNVQWFNVNNSEIKKDEQYKISFKISGASAFKQLAVQSNVNGWSWDEAPKIWNNDGIADNTAFSAIITATQDCEKITFKLWLDNPVAEGFDTASVPVTLTNLEITDIAPVGNLGAAYKDYFTVGAAVTASMIDKVEYQNLIKKCFTSITPENEMKPDALLNQKASQEAATNNPGADPVLYLEYSGMTKILDFAKANGLKVRGHALIYAAQTPDWFFHEGYTKDGKNVKSAVMDARMESYIKQVMQFVNTNYPGVVTAWDVVNEALDDDGYFKEDNWYAIMGESYLSKAFQYATKYSNASTKLYYNDYNMELNYKKEEFLNYAKTLPAGARIDGVGMQEHVTLSYPTVAAIGSAIDAYNAAGLNVEITELDVQIEADQTMEEQADRYAQLFTLFKSKSDKISNVTLWGVNDGSSWKSSKRPLLFYDDLSPKPAFESILGLVTP